MFAEYLRELHKVELLAPGDEARLWQAYKLHGDRRSRAHLIEAYQPLVFKVAMHLRLRELALMDMVQEGTVGLIEAAERFDPGRGVRFSTYATYRIRGRMLNALRRERTACAGAASMDQDLRLLERIPDPTAVETLAAVEDAVLARQIVSAIDHLPDRERRILKGALLDSEEPRHIAEELRISLSHFYRLQKSALHRIRRMLTPAGLAARPAPE